MWRVLRLWVVVGVSVLLPLAAFGQRPPGGGTSGGGVLTHATDCLSGAVSAELGQVCVDLDDGKMWTCKTPSAGGASATLCDAAGDWLATGFTVADGSGLIDLNGATGATQTLAGSAPVAVSTNTGTNTTTISLSGAAPTATALAANGANCSAGNAPLGVDASGAAEGCYDVATQVELNAYVPPTATALAANGANCSAGSAPVGVDASGAAEGCVDVATQTELNTVTSGLAATGTINQAGNPVDWTQLKNVPAGFADGTDDGGGGGGGSVTLTGDVTGSGTGTVATTIANSAVTGAKIANNTITSSKIQGTIAMGNGGTGQSTAPDNNMLVGDGTQWVLVPMTGCSSPTTDKLLYNSVTKQVLCGTDQNSGGTIETLQQTYDASGSTPTIAVSTNGVKITGLSSSTQSMQFCYDSGCTKGKRVYYDNAASQWVEEVFPSSDVVLNAPSGKKIIFQDNGTQRAEISGSTFTAASGSNWNYESAASVTLSPSTKVREAGVTASTQIGTFPVLYSAQVLNQSTYYPYGITNENSGTRKDWAMFLTNTGNLEFDFYSAASSTGFLTFTSAGGITPGGPSDFSGAGTTKPFASGAGLAPTAADTCAYDSTANLYKCGNGTTAKTMAYLDSSITPVLSAFSSGAQGVVPASGGGTTNFMRADGTWAAPPNVTSGAPGYAPASGGGTTNFLRADGTWTTVATFGTSNAGIVPASGGGTTNYLRADGTWAAPAGGGGGGDASTNTATSVDSEIALFSGTAGKTIKRATTTGILKGASGVIGAADAGDLGAPLYAADAGSTDSYAATLSPAPAAYVTGAHYHFKANTANTGVATVNFNSLGAKTIKKVQGGVTTDLADNDIRAGQILDVVYDGTNMQMLSQLGNAGAGGGGGDVTASWAITSDISPSQLTADQDDWSPTGLSSATVIRIDADKPVTIKGLAGGADGRIIVLVNVAGVPILLPSQTGTTAANRFAFPDTVLMPGQSLPLIYDSTSSRWRAVSGGSMRAVTDIASRLTLDEEFLGGTGSTFSHTWQTQAAGTGASGQAGGYGVNSTEKAIGSFQIDTGTTSTGTVSEQLLQTNGTTFGQFVPALGVMVATWRLAVEALSTSSEEYIVRAGMHDASGSSTGDATDGLYFEYDRATAGDFWRIVASGSSTRTKTTSSFAVTTGFVYLMVVTDASWSNAWYFARNTGSATWTYLGTIADANIPTSSELMGPNVKIEKTVGTTQRNLSIDAFDLVYEVRR